MAVPLPVAVPVQECRVYFHWDKIAVFLAPHWDPIATRRVAGGSGGSLGRNPITPPPKKPLFTGISKNPSERRPWCCTGQRTATGSALPVPLPLAVPVVVPVAVPRRRPRSATGSGHWPARLRAPGGHSNRVTS